MLRGKRVFLIGNLLLVAGAVIVNVTARSQSQNSDGQLTGTLNRDYASPLPTSPEERFNDKRLQPDPDGFPAADDPVTVPAAGASFMRDQDEVLGFVINGHARAYPIQVISYHHIINDTLGGSHLTATY